MTEARGSLMLTNIFRNTRICDCTSSRPSKVTATSNNFCTRLDSIFAMAGDKIPSIHALEKPENVHEMLRKDRQEDCLSCKVVGSGAFLGLAGYSYFSGMSQLERQRNAILKSQSRFGMRSRKAGIVGISLAHDDDARERDQSNATTDATDATDASASSAHGNLADFPAFRHLENFFFDKNTHFAAAATAGHCSYDALLEQLHIRRKKMPITILRPQPAAQQRPAAAIDSDYDYSDSEGGVDVQGDVPMRAAKRQRTIVDEDAEADEILTPGSIITSNPQWMR
ncbi:hypothetical protein NLG97_g9512 [Lecanicillium saksenae]|uniref:Uncharacterized protein n=1 Tax=Lecanicillium saksenae TaxID=468837 RepID=A0ACC1QIS8_9HYPO|nr:hypothetical protein NLG97_g9512 [Lecanicillium saksenae]